MTYVKDRTQLNNPAISWGAVFGGWIFASAFALLLYVLGAAAGLTTMSALNEFSLGVTIGTGIWMGVAWVLATWAGAYFAGRLCGRTDKGTGSLHGMIVWALSSVLTLVMASMQIGAAATAGANVVKGAANAGTQAVQAAGNAGQEAGQQAVNQAQQSDSIRQIAGSLADRAKQTVGQTVAQNSGVNSQEIQQAMDKLDSQTTTDVGTRLVQGDTQGAKQILTDRTDLSPADIDSVIAGISQQAQQTGQDIKNTAGAAAEQGADYASGALWAAFLLSLLGLGAGALGGAAGARRAARIYGETVVAVTDVPLRTDATTTAYDQRRAV